MDFNSYLTSKKINPDQFKINEIKLFEQFYNDFDQMSEASFTAQKLFLINKIRRKFPLGSPAEEVSEKPVVKAKPKMMMKPKNQ